MADKLNNFLPLEDEPRDVIAKAMRGLGLTLSDLAEKSGLPARSLRNLLDGKTQRDHLKKIAPTLGLNPLALAELEAYKPAAKAPIGLHQIVSPFGHAGANAYIIAQGKTANIFDTGTDYSLLINFIKSNKLQIEAIYITHRHQDHMDGLSHFGDTPIIFPEEIKQGEKLTTRGGGIFKILDLSGHADPARGFYFEGLSVPLCIVGDSIFAGSMGGTQSLDAYQQALTTVHENILTLPHETILCPGHGPLSTLAQELTANPFLNY